MSVALVSLIQVNKDERESHEKDEGERLQAQQRDEIEKLAAKEKAKRSAVLIEWERTCSPPQSEEVCFVYTLTSNNGLDVHVLYHSCS